MVRRRDGTTRGVITVRFSTVIAGLADVPTGTLVIVTTAVGYVHCKVTGEIGVIGVVKGEETKIGALVFRDETN